LRRDVINFTNAFFAIIGGLFAWCVVPPSEFTMLVAGNPIPVFANWARLAISLSSAVMWGFLSLVYTRVRRHKEEREEFLSIVNRIHNKVDNIDKKLEEKLGNLIEHAAFYTENKKLEGAITSLRNTQGKKMWIIAKFISKQLARSLSSGTIAMNANDYSEFAENLYPECEDFIFLTCPFTPKEWFDELYPPERVEKIKEGNSIESNEIPRHVKALSASPASVKRLVILNSHQFEKLYDTEQIFFLKEFLEVNEGVDTMFVYKEKLLHDIGFDYDERRDYAIFDKQLLLIWERGEKESKAGEERTLFLEPKFSTNDRNNLLKIFDFERRLNIYKTGEAIIEEVKSKQCQKTT